MDHTYLRNRLSGAVYSRISSHVLGDWNACGKIMGLAPWSDRKRKEAVDWYYDKKGQSIEQLGLGDKFYHKHNFMRGNPFDGSFSVNWEELDTLSDANSWTESNFGYYANLAKSVQENLEDCSSQLIQSLQEFTGEKNIALAGGVALNSVMNGKVLASKKFENVFVPPAPGDEGIAVGCAMYGYQVSAVSSILFCGIF